MVVLWNTGRKVCLPHAIVLIGPQGSGKGEAVTLFTPYDFYPVEIGKILRADERFANYTNNGKLCPDTVVKNIIKEEVLNAGNKDFILDGAPRSRYQVDMVCETLASYELIFVYLECRYDVSLQRIEERITKANSSNLVRADDINRKAVTDRLNYFVTEIDFILENISKTRHKLIEINANLDLINVRRQFASKVFPLVFPRVRV